MNKQLEQPTSLENKGSFKYIFKSYLRFLLSLGRRGFHIFKWCVYHFGLESIVFLGCYMAFYQIRIMKSEFAKVLEEPPAMSNRFDSKNKIDF